MSFSSYGANENYSNNYAGTFKEQTELNDDGYKEYLCDDLKEKKVSIKEKTCLDALRTYNKQRKSEGKPTCSVRRLHKNNDGCYCFPRVAKGSEITNMCQEKRFYKRYQNVLN